MFNLFAAVYNEIGGNSTIGKTLEQNDKKVLFACLVTAVSVAAIGIYIACCGLKDPPMPVFHDDKNAEAAQGKGTEEEGASSDEEGNVENQIKNEDAKRA
jgi:hypothetical protein